MDIRIPFLNAFKLRITGNITSGTHTEAADMNVVRNLIVNFVRRGRIFQAHGIDMQGRIVILNLGTLPSGTYGVELVGYYNGEPWRFFKKDVFEIVRQNSDATPAGSGDVPTYDVTFELNFGGESVSPEYVDAAIAAHDADEQAHADIREAMEALETELRQEIAEAGEVNDVQIDGQSILDPETKVANIDSSQFGKVDDVEVNGQSVLDPLTKKASIKITASVVENDEPGTPAANATMQGGNINIEFEHVKGDPLTWDDLTESQKASLKGEQGDSAIWDENEPHEKLTNLAHVLGDSTVKPMSQKGVTNAIVSSLSPDFKTKDVTEVQSLKINTESNPAVTEAQSSAAWRLYYAQIKAGRPFRITFQNSSYTSRKVTIAVFRSVPNTEGVEAAAVLIDEERNLSEGVAYTFIPNIDGYVAFGNYAQKTQVTMEESVSVTERVEETSGKVEGIESAIDGETKSLVAGTDYQTTSGKYININGSFSEATNSKYTSPIKVHKGDKITYTCHGGASGNIATLSRVVIENSSYVKLVSDTEGVIERTYTVEEDMEVAISWWSGSLSAQIHSKGLQEKTESLEEKALQASVNAIYAKEKVDGENVSLIAGDAYTVTTGKFINKVGGIGNLNSGRYTTPISVNVGDVITYSCYGGSPSGGCVTLSKVLAEGSRYSPLVPHDELEYAQRTYTAEEDMQVAFSWVAVSGSPQNLTAVIHKSGLQGKIQTVIQLLEATKQKIVQYDNNDGMPKLDDNPLARMITGPSRARIFKSYGIIGASFESGAENPSTGGQIYNQGYEWPTLFGKVNDVTVYNYALAGNSLNEWLSKINDTTIVPKFDGHCVPWLEHATPAECYLINMSSNDLTRGKYSGAAGNVESIDPEHDYTQDAYAIDKPYTEVLAAIIQLCRQRSPKCFILLATVRKISLSDYTLYRTPEEIEELCDAMKAVAEKFSHCFVLDINTFGFDWPTWGRSYGYQSSVGIHPTRLGHIHLANQFNTFIDWIVAKNPTAFREVSSILLD